MDFSYVKRKKLKFLKNFRVMPASGGGMGWGAVTIRQSAAPERLSLYFAGPSPPAPLPEGEGASSLPLRGEG